MDTIYSLYSEFINNSLYVFYKNNDNIIIMEQCGELTCISNVMPKKYFSDNLKIILMFKYDDPYKLLSNTGKYKINEHVNSYCYKVLEEACNLTQEYYSGSEQKAYEGCFLNNKEVGLWQYWYENGEKSVEGNYINGKQDGLWKLYRETGEKNFEEYFVDGEVTCASNGKPKSLLL